MPRYSKESVQTFSGRERSTTGSPWRDYSTSFLSFQHVDSIPHVNWRQRLGSGSDVGGPLFIDKVLYDIKPIQIKVNHAEGDAFGASLGGYSYSPELYASEDDAKAFGTKAIALAAPTNPSSSLAVTLGELKKDGLPAVIGSQAIKEKTRFLKGAGSEYLNVEFGWKPLISDVLSLAHTVRNHDKIISDYREGSDKKIRRRRSTPATIDSNFVEGAGHLYPRPRNYRYEGSAHESRTTQAWFSGAFRYHIPLGDDVASRMSRYKSYAGKLLGVRLTPDTLWELAPWSWAVDWYADVGSIMTNISNLGTDGLVMQYGYSMSTVESRDTTSFTYQGQTGYFRRTRIQKIRVPASPYGFNVTFDGLSTRQLAICAALGITRGQGPAR